MYTIAKVHSIIKKMKLIRKIKFVAIAFDLSNKIFIIYIAFSTSFNLGPKSYPFWKAQIVFPRTIQTLSSTSSEYSDFADVFSKNLVAKPLKHTRNKNHIIDLVGD